jgi:hypothetical protein
LTSATKKSTEFAKTEVQEKLVYFIKKQYISNEMPDIYVVRAKEF